MKKRRLTPLGWVIVSVIAILSLIFIPPFLASFQPKPSTCKGFAIEGIVNIPKGNSNYNSALDRNHDDIACNQ